jgi:hypothetical protein
MGGWAIQEVLKECTGRTARDRAILAACGCSGMASSQEIAAAEADASEFSMQFIRHLYFCNLQSNCNTIYCVTHALLRRGQSTTTDGLSLRLSQSPPLPFAQPCRQEASTLLLEDWGLA